MKRIGIIFVCLMGGLCRSAGSESPTSTQSTATRPAAAMPVTLIGNIDRSGLIEPSGIVFHPQRRTLFAVGDEGDLCEIKTDGTLVRQKRIRRADFEGITCDPSTGLLYIAIEGEEKIIEIDPKDFEVLRHFTVERTFHGKTVLKAGGAGIEAIAFVGDPNHPEGGTFYLANQCFTMDDEEDASAVLEVEVPLKTRPGKNSPVRIVRYIPMKVTDLSDLYYHRRSESMYLISDINDLLMKITQAGDIIKVYKLPGENQEGITLDDDGYLYIAQDSGGIIKWKLNKRL